MKQPVIYYQTDSRWKNSLYACKGESSTIGGSGCGPTALAMVLATWADSSVTPKTECDWAESHGYKCYGNGTYYSYFVPACARYNLKCVQLNRDTIYENDKAKEHDIAKQAIENNHLVIACMGPGTWTKGGHFVLVYNIKGNTIYINDPASSSIKRTQGSYATFKKQVKLYWVIYNPITDPLNSNTDKGAKTVKYKATVTASVLNCRTGPGTGYPVVRTYTKNTEVVITKESGNWGQTSEGWISLEYVNNKINIVEVTNPTPSTQKTDEIYDLLAKLIDYMTEEQAYKIYKKACDYMNLLPEPEWSKAEGGMDYMKSQGLMSGQPERPVKRDELAAVLFRQSKK